MTINCNEAKLITERARKDMLNGDRSWRLFFKVQKKIRAAAKKGLTSVDVYTFDNIANCKWVQRQLEDRYFMVGVHRAWPVNNMWIVWT